MTDGSLDRRDELASALLDGEVTGDSLAEDPAVLRRAEQLRAAAQAVRAPVPPAPAPARDAAIAAALDAHRELTAAAAQVTTPPAARWRWGRAPWSGAHRLRVLGAAAAVLLVLAAIPVLASLSRTSEDDTAAVDAETEADALMETFGAGADDLATADAAGPGDEMRQAVEGDGAAGGGGGGLVDLGVHDDTDSLVATAAAAAGLGPDRADPADPPDPAESAPAPGTGGAAPSPTTSAAHDARPCEAEIAALDGEVLLVGLARLGSTPVVVAVLDQPEGAVMVLLDPNPPACTFIGEEIQVGR